MKILSWNINGIRAVKSPLSDLFQVLDADIICLQETKISKEQFDEASAIVEGYNSYFSFSKTRSGYSGVATFIKNSCTPVKVEEGLTGLLSSSLPGNIGHYGSQSDFSNEELHALDNEGRALISELRMMDCDGNEQTLTIINVYCPRADPDKEHRKAFKMNFYRLLQIRAEAIMKAGSHVIILGDINTSHRKIDHCNPVEDEIFNAHPGRKWLNQLLFDPTEEDPTECSSEPADPDTSFGSTVGHNFIDTFRMFHPTQTCAYTCWETFTGARATNYGVRIDYILADVELAKKAFSDCVIRPDIEGSDHCPVKATLDWEVIPAKKCPPLCTKYLPEFSGKQQKLLSFFSKKPKASQPSQPKDIGNDTSQPAGVTNSSNTTDSFQGSQGSSSSSDSKPDPELVSAQESAGNHPEPSAALKRKCESVSPSQTASAKKVKKSSKPSAPSSKQGNLLSFFSKSSGKKSPVGSQEHSSKPSAEVTTKSCSVADSAKSPDNTCMKSSASVTFDKDLHEPSKDNKTQNTAKSSWKELLKGPPPPPLCKGHKESCLLRTVKKEGPNKGRQFWVCPRPDGHKTNPEARCDTFMWISNKK